MVVGAESDRGLRYADALGHGIGGRLVRGQKQLLTVRYSSSNSEAEA